MFSSPQRFEGSRFRRVLGLLLVGFIVYGTTVEAAHRHGQVLPNKPVTATAFESDQSGSLSNSKTNCSDCLICQLHQSFSTTLVVLRTNDAPVQIRQSVPESVTRITPATVSSPTSGRAPPQIS